jgi:hypothetical protein
MTEDTSAIRQQRPAWIWGLLIVGLLLLCCLCCVCGIGLGAAGWLGRDNVSPVAGPLASATPTITPPSMPTPTRVPGPSPTVTLPFLQGKTPTLRETFDANTRGWRTQAQGPTQVRVENGQLRLTMGINDQHDIVWCADGCGPYPGSYYYQADLTLKATGDVECYHGLVFGLTGNDYYSFQILQDSYHLAKSAGNEWLNLIDLRASTAIRETGVNTLGVYVHAGQIDLYINGVMVDTYKDPKPLAPGQIGFFIKNMGEVLVDNVLVYADGSTSAPAEPARAFAGPILSAIASRPPTYQDDFGDPKSGWEVWSRDEGDIGGEIGYADGEYFMSVKPASASRPWVFVWTVLPAPEMADFVLELDGQFVTAESPSSLAGDYGPDRGVRIAP